MVSTDQAQRVVAQLRPGEWHPYHRGYLPDDRIASPNVAALADYFFSLASPVSGDPREIGGRLVQRRHAAGQYEYIYIHAKPIRGKRSLCAPPSS